MPNLGDIDAQSLAGALATGTHGTGTRLPEPLRRRSRRRAGPRRRQRAHARRRRRAARRAGRLGALGVIAAVTLRCVPAFRLRNIDRPEPLEDVLAELAGARRRPRPLRVLDVPARGRRAHAHARRAPRTPPRRARPRPRLHERHPDGQPRVPRRQRGRAPLPAHDPAAEPLRVRGRLAARARRLVVRASSPASGSCASRRWSTRVPREHAVDGACAPRAPSLERHPVSFPIELRFSAADDALLSPAHGRDSAFVAVHVFRAMAYEPAFREVEAALSDARRPPALGQAVVPDRAPSSRPRYPRWDAFQAHPRRARPGRPVRQRVGARRAGMSAMKTLQHLRRRQFEYDPEDPEGYRAGMDRFGPKIGASEDRRARSTSCRPGRRCARTTTSPTRSGCIVLEGELTVRHPDGDGRAGRPATRRAFPVGPDGAHKMSNATDETVRFLMLSTRDEPASRSTRTRTRSASGPAARTSTCSRGWARASTTTTARRPA